MTPRDGFARMRPNEIRRRECLEDSRRRQGEGPRLPKHLRDPVTEQELQRKLKEEAEMRLREEPLLNSAFLGDEIYRLPAHLREAIAEKERNEAAPKTHPDEARAPSKKTPGREICWCCVWNCPPGIPTSGISARPCCTKKPVKPSSEIPQETVQLTRPLTQYSVSPQQPSYSHPTSSVVHHEPVYSSPTTQVSIIPQEPIYRDSANQTSDGSCDATDSDETATEKVNKTEEADAPLMTDDALPIWRPTIASKARERKKHE